MKVRRSILALATLAFLMSCNQPVDDSNEIPEIEGDATEEVEATEEKGLNLERDPRSIGGEKAADQIAIEEAQRVMDDQTENEIVGHWVGDFGNNKINLTIYNIDGQKANGYSVCAGNFRPVEGVVGPAGEGYYHFELAEPGDDPYDGSFSVTINVAEQTASGRWEPFKEEGNTAKEFTLAKRQYNYDPAVGTYPEASLRVLSDEELSNLLPETLELMRNAIYARHGYSFKNKEMRYVFNQEDWYIPMGVDIREELTDIEAQNISNIYTYESYYDEFYDDFGR